MRVARVNAGGHLDFAVQNKDDAWVPLSTMGIEARDTGNVIKFASRVREALVAGRGKALEHVGIFACPIVRPSKIVGIGLNYRDHARETGADAPEKPICFAKYPSSLNGPYDPIIVDPGLSRMADYECELAVVLGRRTRSVGGTDPMVNVFGYMVANDVTARDMVDPQLSLSKSYDTFCPMGPWITTADEVSDPQDLPLTAELNGQRRQDSNTREMIFSVAGLVEYLSRTMTLEPGDVILTGTPAGVGFAKDPPVFLRPGDVVVCEIEGLGRIANRVVLPKWSDCETAI